MWAPFCGLVPLVLAALCAVLAGEGKVRNRGLWSRDSGGATKTLLHWLCLEMLAHQGIFLLGLRCRMVPGLALMGNKTRGCALTTEDPTHAFRPPPLAPPLPSSPGLPLHPLSPSSVDKLSFFSSSYLPSSFTYLHSFTLLSLSLSSFPLPRKDLDYILYFPCFF